MAMITCPNCGEKISDKAKSCVHCGVSLLPEEKVICEECGAELEEGIEICPSCGCPVTLSEDSSKGGLQQVEVAGVRMTNVTKKKMAIAIGIILLMAVVILVASLIQKKIVADKAQKTEKEYAVNLQTITKTMLDSADEAESCGNLIKSVWYNAIYNKNDASTDKYTVKDEHFFVSDFNDALHKLFSDLTFSSRVDKISEQQDTVNALMKKLKNPPEKYKEAYEKMSKLYDSYIKLTNMVTDPNGSLQTYSDTFNETDTEVLNNYKALGVYLEE